MKRHTLLRARDIPTLRERNLNKEYETHTHTERDTHMSRETLGDTQTETL